MKKTYLVIFVLMILGLTTTGNGQTALAEQLAALADGYGGTIGIAAKNFKTGEMVLVNAEQKFPSASVIKIPIMVEFFYQMAEGKVDSMATVTVSDSNQWSGSGVLQFLSDGMTLRLIDAVVLMIILSDNTATNLVIDALGPNHEARLAAINQRMISLGLKNTRLLNKMMSWKTKTNAPESVRYGVGVTTAADLVLLLEKIYRGELVSHAASARMVTILSQQQYDTMIPRFLPFETHQIKVAHKTGGVTETRADAGLVYAPNADFALAVICDQSRDHRGSPDNEAELAAAHATRLIWNHFTNSTDFAVPEQSGAINWYNFPAGKWAKLDLSQAPFPHPDRKAGFSSSDGVVFPYKGHYDDSSAVIIVPASWHPSAAGIDLIVHFHGHRNDGLNVMEQFELPQQLIAANKNALLFIAQGPKQAPDSFGGKMEQPGGFKRFVAEIIDRLAQDGLITDRKIGRIIISAHSGGYRPAAFVLEYGEIEIAEVYLFDAFYGQHDKIFNWVRKPGRKLISIYTEHLAPEHQEFLRRLREAGIAYATELSANQRLTFYPTDVCHNCVMKDNLARYLLQSCLESF